MRTGLHSNRRNRASEMETRFPILPTYILKYNFENYKNISKTKCPVYIFHGENDQLLSYSKSLELKKYFKKGDAFISLANQGHNKTVAKLFTY